MNQHLDLKISGSRLYVGSLFFSHVEVKDGNRDKSYSGTIETRFSHHHGRNLPHAAGLGWVGGEHSCHVVLGRVVKSDGSVIPCLLSEARLLGMLEMVEEKGGKSALEINGGADV